MSAGLRFGILGAARITPAALIYPAGDVAGVDLRCVAARDPKRAQAFAAEHGIPEVLEDYAAVVAADVDAIYNPLPISAHHDWTVAALAAGHHVLCEKAIAMNAREAQAMADAAAAADRVLMEAFHYRYHPLFGRVLELLADGAVGQLRHLEGRFGTPHIQPGDIRFAFALGGGALMDLGCYPVHWLRHATGEEPTVVSAAAETGPPQVDLTMRAALRFPSGCTGEIFCSMRPDARREALLEIRGTGGTLRVVNPLAPQQGHELQLERPSGTLREAVDRTPTYRYQLEAFVASLREPARNLTPAADAVANMRVIDGIYRAAGLVPRGEA